MLLQCFVNPAAEIGGLLHLRKSLLDDAVGEVVVRLALGPVEAHGSECDLAHLPLVELRLGENAKY